MSGKVQLFGLVTLTTVLLAACSSSTAPPKSGSLAAITPAPNATGVSTTTSIVATFSQPMMPEMEQYVDLHVNGVDGQILPMGCTWNGAQTTLTCTPDNPLAGNAPYTIHLGASMIDQDGAVIDMASWTSMGGQWATSGMMGGMHGGMPLGSMGFAWKDGMGHYGMLFSFTTN
jgi:hypothetical protein